MKNVLIVPSNTDLNRGDQSLTWASIDIVKEVFDDNCNIYLYKTKGKLADKKKTNHQTESLGYPFLVRILPHPRRNDTSESIRFTFLTYISWGLIAFFDLFVTLCLLSKLKILNSIAIFFLDSERKDSLEKFKKMDVLFVKGGGFLHSYGSIIDPYIMYFQLFDVFLANRYNIPVIILPNSIGPLKNKLAKWVVLSAINKAKYLSVREGKSFSFLKENNISSLLSPDLGFYLPVSEENLRQYLESKGFVFESTKNVAITMRPYRFDGSDNSKLLYDNYLNCFIELIKNLCNKNIHVSLMAHTLGPSTHEDDTIPLLEVYESVKHLDNVYYLHDPHLNSIQIQKLYSYFDCVIGTRFHSVIFSLNVMTPSIAISYGGNKALGIMKDIGIEEYVFPIENPQSEKIFELTLAILNDSKDYNNKVEKYQSELLKKRKSLISDIKQKLV